MASCLVYKVERGRRWHLECWRLCSQVTTRCDGALLSWRWLNSSLPMRINESIICFIYLCVCFLLSLLNWLYLNSRVFQLLPFHSHPDPAGGGVNERLPRAWLLAGVKWPQLSSLIIRKGDLISGTGSICIMYLYHVYVYGVRVALNRQDCWEHGTQEITSPVHFRTWISFAVCKFPPPRTAFQRFLTPLLTIAFLPAWKYWGWGGAC